MGRKKQNDSARRHQFNTKKIDAKCTMQIKMIAIKMINIKIIATLPPLSKITQIKPL